MTSIDQKIKKNKFLIVFLLFISVISLCGFCYQSTKSNVKDTVELLIVDTVDLSQLDTFMINSECNEKNVLIYMHKVGFSHPFESCAQMALETTVAGKSFNSQLVKERNNLGGYQTSNGYMYFSHWTECIRFAKRWQLTHGLKKKDNFYMWLSGTNYHESDKIKYNNSVKTIEIKLRQTYTLKDILLWLK